MNNRSAFTLTELLVTMSAGSTLMIMAIGMIHQTMTLASTSRQAADNDRSVNRLAEQFRHDVHRAQEVIVESAELTRIVIPRAGEVTYLVSDHHVVRQQPLDKGRHREEYVFDASIQVEFSSQRDPARALMTVRRDTGLQGADPRVDRLVAAVVGRVRIHELGEAPSP